VSAQSDAIRRPPPPDALRHMRLRSGRWPTCRCCGDAYCRMHPCPLHPAIVDAAKRRLATEVEL